MSSLNNMSKKRVLVLKMAGNDHLGETVERNLISIIDNVVVSEN